MVGADQQVEHLADRSFADRRFGQRQMLLNDVTIAPAFALFQHVAGAGQVVDDRVRAPLGNGELICDIAQADAGVVRDAQQRAPVVRQKSPLGHRLIVAKYFR